MKSDHEPEQAEELNRKSSLTVVKDLSLSGKDDAKQAVTNATADTTEANVSSKEEKTNDTTKIESPLTDRKPSLTVEQSRHH